jgi:hypothetical protein
LIQEKHDERDFSGFLCAATKGLERKRWRCMCKRFVLWNCANFVVTGFGWIQFIY